MLGKHYLAVMDYLEQDRLLVATFAELEGGLVHDDALYARLCDLLSDEDEFNTSNQESRFANDPGYVVQIFDSR